MGFLDRVLAVRPEDIFDIKIDHADVAVAVPFAMNRDGSAQSAQGSKVVAQTIELCRDSRVQVVIASGGHKVGCGPTEADWAVCQFIGAGMLAHICSENVSVDTHGNAILCTVLLRRLIREHNGRPLAVVLVVQKLQAKRALAAFRKVAADQGVGVTFTVLLTDSKIWRDNAKRTLRSRLLFGWREILVAWPLFKVKGWV